MVAIISNGQNYPLSRENHPRRDITEGVEVWIHFYNEEKFWNGGSLLSLSEEDGSLFCSSSRTYVLRKWIGAAQKCLMLLF